MIQNELRIFGLIVVRRSHQLVLTGIDLEAGVIGYGRKEQAERMGEVNLLEDLETIAFARRRRRRRPFADPVHGEDCSLFER